MKQATKPTTEIIRIAETLMVAMAFEATIRPVVEDYEMKILIKNAWHIDPQFGMADEIILNRMHSFLLPRAAAADFHKQCLQARDAAGLKTAHPEGCPLLEAENARIQAENALLKEMGTLPGLESFKNAGWRSPTVRKEAIELALRFAAPFVGNAATILPRFFETA